MNSKSTIPWLLSRLQCFSIGTDAAGVYLRRYTLLRTP